MARKSPADIDTHGQSPVIPGTFDAYLASLPHAPHDLEPVNAWTQEEIDQAWHDGLEEEKAQLDADKMHQRERTAQHISDALSGTKTALQSNGRYATGSNLEPGRFLPGFGPVTYTNRERADAHARELNRRKNNKQR